MVCATRLIRIVRPMTEWIRAEAGVPVGLAENRGLRRVVSIFGRREGPGRASARGRKSGTRLADVRRVMMPSTGSPCPVTVRRPPRSAGHRRSNDWLCASQYPRSWPETARRSSSENNVGGGVCQSRTMRSLCGDRRSAVADGAALSDRGEDVAALAPMPKPPRMTTPASAKPGLSEERAYAVAARSTQPRARRSRQAARRSLVTFLRLLPRRTKGEVAGFFAVRASSLDVPARRLSSMMVLQMGVELVRRFALGAAGGKDAERTRFPTAREGSWA